MQKKGDFYNMMYFSLENDKILKLFTADNIDEAINYMYYFLDSLEEIEKSKYQLRLKFVTSNDFNDYKKLDYYICNGNMQAQINSTQMKLSEVFDDNK